MNDDTYDFGEDADVEFPADPHFDAWVASAAPSVNAPPATPRLEMWDGIVAAQKTAQTANAGRVPGVLPLRRAQWLWLTAIAAALLLGVGIDRYSFTRHAAPIPREAVVQPSSDPAKLYRLAAAQTLSQAEALLTAYRSSELTGENVAAAKQLGAWGREVLSSTRLLIDSPAGTDPRLRALLRDLELVLAQIIQLSGAPLDTNDRALIDHAMREHDLLPRIRTAVPAGVGGSASDE